MNPDLIQRALLHYCRHLEAQHADDTFDREFYEDGLSNIEAFLFSCPASGALSMEPTARVERIIEELKRRGLGNGKVGE